MPLGTKLLSDKSACAEWKFGGRLAQDGHWTRLLRGSQGLGLVPQVGTCLLTSPPLWLGVVWQKGTRSGWSVRRKGRGWGTATGQTEPVLSLLLVLLLTMATVSGTQTPLQQPSLIFTRTFKVGILTPFW